MPEVKRRSRTSLSARALSLFLVVLLMVGLLGAGFFWYQRTLFDPRQYNEQLMSRVLNLAHVLSFARPESAQLDSSRLVSPRLEPLVRSEGGILFRGGTALDPSLVQPLSNAPGEVEEFAQLLAERLASPPNRPREWRRAERANGRPARGPRGRVEKFTFGVEVVLSTPELLDALQSEQMPSFGSFESATGRPFDRRRSDQRFSAVRRFAVLVQANGEAGGRYSVLIWPSFRNQGLTLLLIGGFIAALLSTAGLALFSILRVTGPIDRLARATREFGDTLQPVEIAGPRTGEVAAAITAFDTMQTQVRTLLEDRNRITGAVSHDLRTYLTRLRLRAELLGEAGRAGESAQKTIADLDEMEAILDGSLAYSKFALRDPKTLSVRSTELNHFLVTWLEARGATGSVPLTLPQSEIFAEVDPMALRRVLDNLLSNAQRYAANPEIQMLEQDGWVEIRLLDEGAPLSDEARTELLRPYARGESSRNRHTGGTGLGLSIANDILAAHGGELRFEQRSDGVCGSCLAVRLRQTTRGSDNLA